MDYGDYLFWTAYNSFRGDLGMISETAIDYLVEMIYNIYRRYLNYSEVI